VAAAVKKFLDGLDDETIYKCKLEGITDEGDIKSPAEGGFCISKHTRVEFCYED